MRSKVMQATLDDVPYIPVFMFPGAWAVKSGWEFKSSIGPFLQPGLDPAPVAK